MGKYMEWSRKILCREGAIRNEKKVPDLDYETELETYREEKYGNEGVG